MGDWRNYAIGACLLALVVIFTAKQFEPVADDAEQHAASDTEALVVRRDAEIARLKTQVEALTAKPAEDEPEPALETTAPAVEQPSQPMCYKDYCPCEPPQEGPDQMFCDQLEEGIHVPIEQLIIGRTFRKGRRQMDEAGY